MKKLTKEEKKEVLQEIRHSGWTGCMCDECLIRIAEKVLDYQFKTKE